MSVWALADFHLSFDTPSKTMEKFGACWADWTTKIQNHAKELIQNDDLLLVAGDISWAKTLDQAKKDLDWIASLPGKKIISKGNHDYWWPSKKKLEEALPPSLYALQGDALTFGDISIAGTRLWENSEFSFHDFVTVIGDTKTLEPKLTREENDKIFRRELMRLERALSQLDQKSKTKIAMVHYPPISADLKPNAVHSLFKQYNVDICVFGHLHSIQPSSLPFGKLDGIEYVLTSADYLEFNPKKIL